MLNTEDKAELISRIQELSELQDQTTPGLWREGHLGNENVACDCTYILSETYCGSVATIDVNNGLQVGKGGNDSPPKAEAVANMRFIAKSHNVDFKALLEWLNQ